MRDRVLVALLLGLAACGDSEPIAPPTAPAPMHSPVVAQAIAEWTARVPEEPAPEEADPELVDGLVQFLVGADARSHDLPLEEIRGVGDGALPALVHTALDHERPVEQRTAAIELIAAIGTRAAGLQLVELCASTNPSWIRAHAAWRLSELDPAIDVVVPGLLLRLRSEIDHEAAIYVAAALASRRNFAGVEMLSRLASEDPDEGARTRAAGQLAAIVEQEGAADARALIDQWDARAPGFRHGEPSDALRLLAWQWIQTLSGDTFQLRPVDDARFLLMRLGPWIVEPLATALDDVDPYVRLHSAQCLERMGAVARPAVPALTKALDDPRLAPQAAMSLGAIGGPGVRESLSRAAAQGPNELRVAAARGLGVLGDDAVVTLLTQIFEDDSEPIDLRQAAAESVLKLRPGGVGSAQKFLVACLTDPAADVGGAERALDAWLGADGGSGVDAETLDAWKAAAKSEGAIPTPAESRARRATRADVLRSGLARRGN
ncbi:MAG: HEAT repeat domain-containing protein [Planctomycetes bacterium]|nr:HEAT repeat domain-containing protein [Planctomycetota bacterium]